MGNNSSSGIVIVLGIFCLILLAPALLCGGLLGKDVADAVGSPWGWVCSLGFWMLLGGGVILRKQIQQSNEDDDGE